MSHNLIASLYTYFHVPIILGKDGSYNNSHHIAGIVNTLSNIFSHQYSDTLNALSSSNMSRLMVCTLVLLFAVWCGSSQALQSSCESSDDEHDYVDLGFDLGTNLVSLVQSYHDHIAKSTVRKGAFSTRRNEVWSARERLDSDHKCRDQRPHSAPCSPVVVVPGNESVTKTKPLAVSSHIKAMATTSGDGDAPTSHSAPETISFLQNNDISMSPHDEFSAFNS